MIFGINGEKLELTDTQKWAVNRGRGNHYEFIGVKQVSEAEMFRIFKKNKSIRESMDRIDRGSSINDTQAMDSIFAQAMLGTSSGHRPIQATKTPKKKETYHHRFPHSGAYIIPKMFGYFPFLDCDDLSSYTEAKFQLCADNIPYISYKSSEKTDHYWIICDKQGEINETIDFIETYPGDHRYPWIARYKQELCIRAIPKSGYVPHEDERYMDTEFSDDFAYWNSQFVKYWDKGLIPSYIDMINTVNAV